METTLSKLVGEHAQVVEMALDPETDQQMVIDTLEAIEGDIAVKADGYGYVMRGLEFERASLNGKREYLQALLEEVNKRDKKLSDTIEGMKDRLMAAMIATGLDETGIKTDQFEFTVQSAGGQQKLEVDVDKCPDSFKTVVQTYKPDNKKIREYLKDHQVEWATILPRKRSLNIKGV